MRTTIIICSFLTVLSIVNLCIFVTNRKMQSYDEKYEQLINGENPTNNISTVTEDIVSYFKTPIFKVWNDENGTFFLKNFKAGYVVYHAFRSDEFIPFFDSDVVSIPNQRFVKMNMDCKNKDAYNGKYIEFTYRGMKYFVVALFDNFVLRPNLIFGTCIPIDEKLDCGINTIKRSAFRFHNKFAHQIYISRWKIVDDEWIKVFRDDNNDICLQFMKDKS